MNCIKCNHTREEHGLVETETQVFRQCIKRIDGKKCSCNNFEVKQKENDYYAN